MDSSNPMVTEMALVKLGHKTKTKSGKGGGTDEGQLIRNGVNKRGNEDREIRIRVCNCQITKSILKHLLLLMCLNVLPVSIHHVLVWCLWSLAEDIRFPGSGVINGVSCLSCGCWEWKLGAIE